MDMIRAFIAIPLPQSLLDEMAALQRQLDHQVPRRSVRWTRTEGIHLTLKFLGNTLAEKLPDIEQALMEVARYAPTGDFAAQGLGCFPNPRRPRVIWIGVQEPTGWLEVLQDAIEEVMEAFGYSRERRGFTPHLTLGRVNRRASRNDVAQIGQVIAATEVGQLAQVPTDRFALIRSELKPTGAEYTELKSFPLRGGSV